MRTGPHGWDSDDSYFGVSQTIGSPRICEKLEGLALPEGENNTMWECGPELHILGEKPDISGISLCT